MSGASEVDALVLAAGRGERLGMGPKAWLRLGGCTLLERAVRTMRGVAGRVIVGVAPEELPRARALCGDAIVVPGGATHRETMLAALRAGGAPLAIVHDVAHPFVTAALAGDVIAAARRAGAAVAAVAATTTAYRWRADTLPERLGARDIWTVRRPFAFRREDFLRGLGAGPADGLSVILARAGVSTALVPAPSWNIKLTTPDDWVLADAIERAGGRT
jgi:2-C-methyl-D-erythritol 4-phosphate cytidylyltransferase